MSAKSAKELDAIDARLRVLIPELPPKASPTRIRKHAQIVLDKILHRNFPDISEHTQKVSELALAILDIPDIA